MTRRGVTGQPVAGLQGFKGELQDKAFALTADGTVCQAAVLALVGEWGAAAALDPARTEELELLGGWFCG